MSLLILMKGWMRVVGLTVSENVTIMNNHLIESLTHFK